MLVLLWAIPLGAGIPDQYKLPEPIEGELKITGVEVRDPGDTTATVTWKTNARSYSRIHYQPYGEKPRSQSKMRGTKQHSMRISNLRPGTEHTVVVESWIPDDESVKEEVSFTTTGRAPLTFVSNHITNRSFDGAILQWRTNHPTRATIRVGHDTPLSRKTVHDKPARQHRVQFSDFYPESRVYYRITATDETGDTITTDLRTFRTREPNLVLNQPVEGTFDREPYGLDSKYYDTAARMIERVNNGITNYRQGVATSGDPDLTTQWFIVDLERPYEIGKAVTVWRRFAYPKHFNIYTSETGDRWITQAEGLNAGEGENVSVSGQKAIRHEVAFDTGTTARFVRVVVPRNAKYYVEFPEYNFVQLFNFKLFPAKGSELYENSNEQ